MNKWIRRKYVHIHIHSGILFNQEKEGNPAVWNNMDGIWVHYIKWNKLSRKRQTAAYRLHVEPKTSQIYRKKA